MEYVKLNNGVEMPVLGFGVYQISDPEVCERAVGDALKIGYRSIDTAAAYGNEEAVGRAVRRSGVPREELFITTKLWISDAGYEPARKAFEESMSKLGLDYLDLYLIHQPYGDVNQVETHPFHQQTAAAEFMRTKGVQIESWAPFAEGKNGLFSNEVLLAVAARYKKTVAQVVLRWLIQRGVVCIPKSVHAERIAENFDVFGFALDAEDMAVIASLDRPESSFLDHRDPETVEWLSNLH